MNKIIEEKYGYVLTDRDVKFNGAGLHPSKEKIKSISSIMGKLVSNTNLSDIIDAWDIGKYLPIESSLEGNDTDMIMAAKADLFKAILGAVALDCSRNQEILKNAVIKMLDIEKCFEEIDASMDTPKNHTLDNAINMLEDILKKGNCPMPIYKCTDKEIYESDGMRWFCSCFVEEWDITVGAYAKDKTLAKKYAAYALLCERFGLVNQYEPNVHGTLYKLKDEPQE